MMIVITTVYVMAWTSLQQTIQEYKKKSVHCFVKIYYTIKECMPKPSFYILHICSQNMFIWCNLYAALSQLVGYNRNIANWYHKLF